MAAVLACGLGAVLSHGPAAVHWGLLRPLEGPIDISIPTQNGRRPRRGVRIHRCSGLDQAHLRTSGSEMHLLGLALGEVKTDRTRSDLERFFLRLCRRSRLPVPEVNVKIDGMTVDFLWRSRRLVVETDSYVTHGGTIAFEDDRERDLRLRRLGYSVHRFSERQLEVEAATVIEDVVRALGR